MIARRPGSVGNAAAGLSAGRVVDAVLVDAFGRVGVVVEERVVVVLAPGAKVVVVVLPVTVGVVKRRVVEGCAVCGLRS